ncbi:MAG: class I SAM-dependent methyltransferase [Candidatus Altiarchaeota archaeon]
MDKTLFHDLINTLENNEPGKIIIKGECRECVNYDNHLFTSTVWDNGIKKPLNPILTMEARRNKEDMILKGIIPNANETRKIKKHLKKTKPDECFITYLAAAENRKKPRPSSCWDDLTEKLPENTLSQRKDVLEHVIRELSGRKGSIIDIGCGDGKMLAMLAGKNPQLELWGVDANKKAVLKAKNTLGEKANILYGDASYMTGFLPGKDFDTATAIGILDTQVTTREESLRILSEIHETLKKDGTLITTAYSLPAITHEETEKKGFNITKKTVPKNFFTNKEPKDMILARKVGFTLE